MSDDDHHDDPHNEPPEIPYEPRYSGSGDHEPTHRDNPASRQNQERLMGGKPVVHIAGAGTLGMAMLIVSLSTLFIASMVAYLFIRSKSSQWPPVGMPAVPASLWLSTFIILAASVTVQMAQSAIRHDDEKRLTRQLIATFIIGMLFLIMQSVNWFEFYLRIRNIQLTGAYLGMFFVLTGLHAAHVIGGLIPLGVVIYRAKRHRYSANFHPGVRYIAVYWHFLDVIWVALFLVLYF